MAMLVLMAETSTFKGSLLQEAAIITGSRISKPALTKRIILFFILTKISAIHTIAKSFWGQSHYMWGIIFDNSISA
jgi:hypothetical protein